MKHFSSKEIKAAMDFADEGGQALHVYDSESWKPCFPDAPRCFKRSARWGHLIDMDRNRLEATARRFGVRVIKVSRVGIRGQHIDLCGKPLQRAIQEAMNG